jgi:hypothetical protein
MKFERIRLRRSFPFRKEGSVMVVMETPRKTAV